MAPSITSRLWTRTRGKTLFKICGQQVALRTASIFGASASAGGSATASGASGAAVKVLSMRLGVNGHSLYFAPSHVDMQTYTNLSYLWNVRPIGAPFGPMRLILPNLVPLLWHLFSGEYGALGGDASEPFVMPPADVRLVVEAISAASKTVPIGQARAMRNIATRCRSSKASD